MQPLDGKARTQHMDDLQPAYEYHDAGKARLRPKLVRKSIRFIKNFSPMRLFQVGRGSLATVLGIAFVAGGLFYAGEENRTQIMASASSFTGFEASKLVIEGNVNLEPNMVRELLGTELGNSMFRFDVDKARQKINAIRWVRNASVRKVFPDTIIVNVEEFEPFALWKVEDNVNLISVDGNVIGRASQRHMLLPQVVGKGANKEAFKVLSEAQQYPSVLDRAKAFVRVGDRRWNIIMKSGMRVMLPENGWQESLESLHAFQEGKQLLDRELVQVDMRLPDRMIMKLNDEDAEVRKTHIRDALKRDWHKT